MTDENALKNADKGQSELTTFVIPRGAPLGLCDSEGTEFHYGSIVRRTTDINNDMHGEWVDYEVTLQGTTPLLSYLRSEKGQVLPVGYTACCLCNEYDHKMFVFAADSMTLRPESSLLVLDELSMRCGTTPAEDNYLQSDEPRTPTTSSD